MTLAAFALLPLAGCGNGNAGTANHANNNSNGTGAARTNAITLNESGSSLLYPLFTSEWIPAYRKAVPSVRLNPASTGSGTGISLALTGAVQIGASDAYLSDAQMLQTPNMLNIPLAISAQQIMYHLPGVHSGTHLNLSGDVLAKMYQGSIRKWNDPRLKALNPHIALPNKPIVLVTRSDGSGDTFLFTQFLSSTNKQWAAAGLTGTTVSFPPVQGELGAKGNSGVVDSMAQTPYSIGYVGVSWLDAAVAKGLGYAALMNRSGKLVLPTPDAIAAAAKSGTKKIPKDERVSLIDQPGAAAYPIVNFEYAIIDPNQTKTVVKPLKSFLTWAVSPTGGNQAKFLKPVHFLPLPKSIAIRSRGQINEIGKTSTP